MDRATKIALITLARKLFWIAGQLANYRHVDEHYDVERLKRGEDCERGPEYAIDNVRALTWKIHLAGEATKQLPQTKLVRAVRRNLVLAHEAIGQADVPAELALLDGDEQATVDCCTNAFRRAHRKCGNELERLAAALLVEADSSNALCKCRLALGGENVVIIDGAQVAVKASGYKLFELLLKDPGEYVPISKHGLRTRDVESLPDKLRDAVESDPGAGTRIKREWTGLASANSGF
jgi:hypothetical protein